MTRPRGSEATRIQLLQMHLSVLVRTVASSEDRSFGCKLSPQKSLPDDSIIGSDHAPTSTSFVPKSVKVPQLKYFGFKTQFSNSELLHRSYFLQSEGHTHAYESHKLFCLSCSPARLPRSLKLFSLCYENWKQNLYRTCSFWPHLEVSSY